jgi:hypothetical protein
MNISVKPVATVLNSLCYLPMIRLPNVLNASVGMSKN